jgi:hypothetical protein
LRKKSLDVPALQRDYTEKLLAHGKFLKENKIYAFCKPDDLGRQTEIACGEKLYMPPNPKQALILEAWDDPEKKVFALTGGNRLGKTVCGVLVAESVVFGRWPWSDKPIPFPHKKSRRVRYIGSGWESHIKTVVIPKLKEWWPKGRPLETKKNNQGVDATWKDLATGSTLEIMSTSQQSDVFEGWDGDLVVYDEPPPREIRVACARGLIDRGGREFFVATLLKEAWIHREVIKALDKDGHPDKTVFNVTGEIYDNVGYGLNEVDIEQFAKTLKPEEKEARLYGKPSYMSSLVFPRFNRDQHIKEPFKIPLDWIVDISIDFHPSKPWAVVFLATAKNNFKYVCKEIWQHGNPKAIAEDIIRIVRAGDYRIGRVTIDPLSRSGEDNDNDVFRIVADTLGSRNISLEVASKDKDNGIALLNNLLWTENSMPGLFFFRDCPKTITQVEDLMYDPESLKSTAMKVDDDFTECLYRLALLDTQWFSEAAYNPVNERPMML